MKRILITGGAGSVGRELSNALIENGDQVRIFDLPFMDFSVFEGHASVEIVKGDITDLETVQAAVKDMEIVVHLAALLPPNSEKNRERTFAINVGGTQNLLEAIKKEGSQSRMIFASSVATYGNTMDEEPPVRVDHHQSAVDIYGETKIESERIMIASGVPYTILRISGISIPAFLDPPEVWPFMHDQRIEFVNRADVFTALFASVQQDKAANKIFNIAGGESWRMLGHEYAEALCDILGMSADETTYRDTPGWCDWYDTAESQALLNYQRTSFPQFLQLLEKAVEEALGW